MATSKKDGIIFDIQHYSIHDGPGIRTTVFLKGCPLNCLWCQNPESQSHHPVLFFHYDRCGGCGRCKAVCPQNAIEIIGQKSSNDRNICDNCGECIPVCPNEARIMKGEKISAAAVFEEVKKDAIFYQNSQGGVTISGGDPLAQPEFVRELSEFCRRDDIHVALETCGFAPWKSIEKIMGEVDLVLYDFKHMDPAAHKVCTGVSNACILENALRVYHDLKKKIHARVPVVSGYNDSCDNIRQTAAFIANKLGGDVEVHLLPYHPLGKDKYLRLEKSYACEDVLPPLDEHMQVLLTIVKDHGLVGRIGG